MITDGAVVDGRKADLLQAAHLGAEAAIRLLKEGKTSTDVKKAVLKLCKDHQVLPIEGMMSHAVGKDSLAKDGLSIVFCPTDLQQRTLQEAVFAPYQVWCVDVAVSLGRGKVGPIGGAHKTTIWAKNEGVTYALKLKGSRAVFSEIQSKFGCMAFHSRSLDDQVKSRMALLECVSHELVQPYEVQGEKASEDLTARFMFTAVVMPAGPLKLTDPLFNIEAVKSACSVSDPELKALLDAPVRPKRK